MVGATVAGVATMVKSASLSSWPALPEPSTASTLILLLVAGRLGTNQEKPVPGASFLATILKDVPPSSER